MQRPFSSRFQTDAKFNQSKPLLGRSGAEKISSATIMSQMMERQKQTLHAQESEMQDAHQLGNSHRMDLIKPSMMSVAESVQKEDDE